MILLYSKVRCPGSPLLPAGVGRPEVTSLVHSGGNAAETGCVPQIMLHTRTDVVVLLAQLVPRPRDGSTTKQRFLATPSVVYLGSASWNWVAQDVLSNPEMFPPRLFAGKRFDSTVSIRALFHTSGSQTFVPG